MKIEYNGEELITVLNEFKVLRAVVFNLLCLLTPTYNFSSTLYPEVVVGV
jgi:hypothetical protein